MHDHVKRTVGDFNLDHIVLHERTNNLNSDRMSSQTARDIVDLALSLRSNKKTVQFHC